MRKTFYTHLIEIHHISLELEGTEMSEKEKNHLIKIFESAVHTSVMDHVLLSLPDEDHERFLKHADQENHDAVWEILNSISNIEEIIRTAAHAVRNEFLRDVQDQKKKQKKSK